MTTAQASSQADRQRALWLSTIAFTTCFAVWMIFSIIGLAIREQLNLSQSEFGLLVAMPVLSGSLTRLILGIWTEQYGGRLVFSLQMLLTAGAVWLLTYAQRWLQTAIALVLLGLAQLVAAQWPLVATNDDQRGLFRWAYHLSNLNALSEFANHLWPWAAMACLLISALRQFRREQW